MEETGKTKTVNLNRRAFLTLLLAAPQATPSIQVAVLETFDIENRARALLVHHADPASRDTFGGWMRSHTKFAARVRTQAGEEENAIIFRVRTCFGRGLILLEQPMQIRERDVLTILM